nr:VasL domain-containing protein [Pantoea sp. 201603H]
MNNRNQLKTGGDPRSLPDYVTLRDELMKLSHPARPDVDWKLVETLCLRLFEHNGVELQTAAWYTLTRLHSAGLTGLNEGLALINALTKYQWSMLWPANTHARMEILSGLIQRLQNQLRTLALNHPDDLSLLYPAEKSLVELSDTLARQGLKQLSRMDVLLQQVRQAIARLENTVSREPQESALVLPPQTASNIVPESLYVPEPLVFVVHSEPAASTTPPDEKRGYIWPFVGGVCLTFVVCAMLFWGWTRLHSVSTAEQQWTASLTPLPESFSVEQLAELRHVSSVTGKQGEAQWEPVQRQLKWLTTLPPDWPQQYGFHLLSQATMLWPDNPVVRQMQQGWQRQTEANALPLTVLNSWHEGMAKLQQLTDRLNALDEKRGKYMTVSELKSEVFAITQTFNQAPPAEELLRQYAEDPHDIQQKQAEMALEQLHKRYFLLQQEKSDALRKDSGQK